MTPEQLAAGQRWAARRRRHRPPATTEQQRAEDFATAEAADERDRWSRR